MAVNEPSKSRELIDVLSAIASEIGSLRQEVAALRVAMYPPPQPEPEPAPLVFRKAHYILLSAVADGPRATTALMQACGYSESNSNTFYRTLADLRNRGLIAKGPRQRSPYTLTPAGAEALRQHRES